MERYAVRASDGCMLNIVRLAEGYAPGGQTLLFLHGGGPDHKSMLPLAERLCANRRILLPDLRGYGRSVCYTNSSFTWKRYAEDVINIIDHMKGDSVVLGGAGIGATISAKVALTYPGRIKGLILISMEEIEDDDAQKEEIAFFQRYIDLLRKEGLAAAWASILPDMTPVIGTMVRDAIPRSDVNSILAATSIVYDRAFKDIDQLKGITVPTLIIPGDDTRHSGKLATTLSQLLPDVFLSAQGLSDKMRSADDFAEILAPVISDFLAAESFYR